MIRLVLCIAIALGGVAAAQPPPERVRIEEPHGRSGFWTSPHPAKTPYRWRLLGIGGALVLITGLVTWRIVKRTKPRSIGRS